jgi:cellulose synthase/poly-beta-1,6-N-acetylglucosamine synthase-like glycosyltransferase
VVAYFVVLNLLYSLFAFMGLRTVITYSRELSEVALRDLLEREVFKPVSILVPAYNEERSIVESVHSFLALRYPRFEVIVVSDGSADGTLERMIKACGTRTSSSWTRRTVGSPMPSTRRSIWRATR